MTGGTTINPDKIKERTNDAGRTEIGYEIVCKRCQGAPIWVWQELSMHVSWLYFCDPCRVDMRAGRRHRGRMTRALRITGIKRSRD